MNGLSPRFGVGMESKGQTSETESFTASGTTRQRFLKFEVVPKNENGSDVPSDTEQCRVAIEDLLKEKATVRLEAGVVNGLNILDSVGQTFASLDSNTGFQVKIGELHRMRESATQPRVIIGVVGSTGAGKSTVINAILNEVQLVPTSCRQACTAVVIEISYNYSKTPFKYQADIDFIELEDWRRELTILRSEILDEKGRINRDAIDAADSDAGKAYSKVRAVYPSYSDEALANTSIETLMEEVAGLNLLGTSQQLKAKDATLLSTKMQRYLNSKTKEAKKGYRKNVRPALNQTTEMEYWPLIKVVRIYTKAEALSTGAVLVDLPGVMDSNAARAAIAEEYMKQCHAIWIVAPIIRAVSDRSAKTLISTAFKQQLKFDGMYGAITFICSKTDEITFSETPRHKSTNLALTVLSSKKEKIFAERKRLHKQAAVLERQKVKYKNMVERDNGKIQEGHAKKNSVVRDSDYCVHTTKRKRELSPASDTLPPSKQLCLDIKSPAKLISQQASSSQIREINRFDLSAADIDEELLRIHAQRDGTQVKLDVVEASIHEAYQQCEELEAKLAHIDNEWKVGCIISRNEFSRTEIQREFANGIRETDMEEAETEDPDNFDPSQSARDYDRLAHNLPVFCVSSKAYQSLNGRLDRDRDVQGFLRLEHTGIPQLQAHCREITEERRRTRSSQFLRKLCALLASLQLWASNSPNNPKASSDDLENDKKELMSKFKDLREELNQLLQDCMDDITMVINDKLVHQLDGAASQASKAALETAEGWGKKEEEGGLLYQTYKATVRRQGVFAGTRGARDFNHELIEPMHNRTVSAWKQVFADLLPKVLLSFNDSACRALRDFCTHVDHLPFITHFNTATADSLMRTLVRRDSLFKDIIHATLEQIHKEQKDINREFKSQVRENMLEAYNLCAAEEGRGNFKRMRAIMRQHVTAHEYEMFQKANDRVRGELADIRIRTQSLMGKEFNDALGHIEKDFSTVVARLNEDGTKVSVEEKQAREKTRYIICKARESFNELLGADVDALTAELADTAIYHGVRTDDGDYEEIVDDTDINEESAASVLDDGECPDDMETVSHDEEEEMYMW